MFLYVHFFPLYRNDVENDEGKKKNLVNVKKMYPFSSNNPGGGQETQLFLRMAWATPVSTSMTLYSGEELYRTEENHYSIIISP